MNEDQFSSRNRTAGEMARKTINFTFEVVRKNEACGIEGRSVKVLEYRSRIISSTALVRKFYERRNVFVVKVTIGWDLQQLWTTNWFEKKREIPFFILIFNYKFHVQLILSLDVRGHWWIWKRRQKELCRYAFRNTRVLLFFVQKGVGNQFAKEKHRCYELKLRLWSTGHGQ